MNFDLISLILLSIILSFQHCSSITTHECHEPIYGNRPYYMNRYDQQLSPINSFVNWWWKTSHGDDILMELFHDKDKINGLHTYYIEQTTNDDNSLEIESIHYGSDIRPLGIIEQIVIAIVIIFWLFAAVYCLVLD